MSGSDGLFYLLNKIDFKSYFFLTILWVNCGAFHALTQHPIHYAIDLLKFKIFRYFVLYPDFQTKYHPCVKKICAKKKNLYFDFI